MESLKLKVLVVFGTRPEAIKMCPIIQELKKHDNIETIVCVTGQHREMLSQVLEVFKVDVQYNLQIMQEKQTLFDITTTVLIKMKDILEIEKPNVVLVHGDTTSAFASALACYYLKIPVYHVEAGLRTYDKYAPYPEEMNRQAIDSMADVFFAPTAYAKENLLNEGRNQQKVHVTGNTVIDALNTTIKEKFEHKLLDWVGNNRLILVTAHRRENVGMPMRKMFTAIKNIIDEFEDVRVIYPLHLNPEVQAIANEIFGNVNKVQLVEPMDVVNFHNFMKRAYLIMTDSGGIQEEATSLGKPVLVMRDKTERPEGVETGNLLLVGTEQKRIENALRVLLTDSKRYQNMAHVGTAYGTGNASEKIVEIILQEQNVQLL